jgi:hypothetical protein
MRNRNVRTGVFRAISVKMKLALAIAAGSILVICFLIWTRLAIDDAAMTSCIWSLEAPIRDDLRATYRGKNLGETQIPDDEARQLIHNAVVTGQTDCSRTGRVPDGFDVWGSRLRVFAIESAGYPVRVRIGSAGPDGVWSTADDIVVRSPSPQVEEK